MPKINRSKLLGFPNSHAILVGIDEYPHINGHLKSAVNDATRLAELLKKEQDFSSVELLTNPTKAELLALFSQLTNEAKDPVIKPEDALLFYYAGHGKAGVFNEGPAGYFLPSDTKPEAANLQNNSLVPMEMLFDTLKQLNCQHTLLILDCCFAGKFRHIGSKRRDALQTHFLPLYEERFERYRSNKAWQVLVSAGPTETAADWMGDRNALEKHSPFAEALFKALEGRAEIKPPGKNLGDGVITAQELYLYLWNEVEQRSRTNTQFDTQHPDIYPMADHEGGQFMFLDPKHALNFAERKERNPYPGLRAYRKDEADLFFGRKKQVQEVLNKLEKTHVLIVSAPSGFGKTSFIQAGVFPKLKEALDAELLVFRPGPKPASEWTALNFKVDLDRQQVVLIDQLEELYTACESAEQQEQFEDALVDLLETLVHHPKMHQQKLKVIFTIRSDFEWQFKASKIAEVFWENETHKVFYRLPPMILSELKEAIVQPAFVEAYDFESETLIDHLLEEASYAPGALPLLSFGMNAWITHTNKQERLLRSNFYFDKLGGISGALSKCADEIYHSLSFGEHDAMQRILLRMVDLKDGAYIRRRVPVRTSAHPLHLHELDYPKDFEDLSINKVLGRLVEAGLVVRGIDAFGQPYVEPVHDALINFWPRCLKWIQDFGEDRLILQRQLWTAVKAYLQDKENAFYWEQDPRLEVIEALLRKRKWEAGWFNQAEIDFIQISQEKQQHLNQDLAKENKKLTIKDQLGF
ncbi:MAG: caspase family protein [Saprospiraceae bacterium]|nr:caspase family protein [Saprospiraceae bacterium]